MGLFWNLKDWWKSRGNARPAPTTLSDTVRASSHSTAGRRGGGFSSSNRALKHMADGAENFQKSLKDD